MIKEQKAAETADLQQSAAKIAQPVEGPQKSSQEIGGLVSAASFTTYFTWTANGVHSSVNFVNAAIKPNSKVFVNISEYSGTPTNRFIGGARMAVYNIAPYNGGFKAWVEITWGSPLTVRFDVFVDP